MSKYFVLITSAQPSCLQCPRTFSTCLLMHCGAQSVTVAGR